MLRGDDGARVVGGDHHQRVVAVELLQRFLHRVDERRAAFAVLLDQMRDDFRVGLALELVTLRFQPLLQRQEILDDPVVDHDHVARAVAMRVRVVLVRLAVRRPARVAHAERAVQLVLDELRLEIRELPFRAHHVHAVAVHDGDAGRVIAAVLEFFQAADQNRDDITRPDVSDDSAHACFVP